MLWPGGPSTLLTIIPTILLFVSGAPPVYDTNSKVTCGPAYTERIRECMSPPMAMLAAFRGSPFNNQHVAELQEQLTVIDACIKTGGFESCLAIPRQTGDMGYFSKVVTALPSDESHLARLETCMPEAMKGLAEIGMDGEDCATIVKKRIVEIKLRVAQLCNELSRGQYDPLWLELGRSDDCGAAKQLQETWLGDGLAADVRKERDLQEKQKTTTKTVETIIISVNLPQQPPGDGTALANTSDPAERPSYGMLITSLTLLITFDL